MKILTTIKLTIENHLSEDIRQDFRNRYDDVLFGETIHRYSAQRYLYWLLTEAGAEHGILKPVAKIPVVQRVADIYFRDYNASSEFNEMDDIAESHEEALLESEKILEELETTDDYMARYFACTTAFYAGIVIWHSLTDHVKDANTLTEKLMCDMFRQLRYSTDGVLISEPVVGSFDKFALLHGEKLIDSIVNG